MSHISIKSYAFSIAMILIATLQVGCGASGGSNVSFGGAQDIGQFRKILNDGQIPASNTLDANGFFSEHFVELPEADCAQVLCLHGMLAIDDSFIGISDDKLTLLGIGINSAIDPEDIDPPPFDLAVVVDASGSMADEDKIVYAKEGLHSLVDAMRVGDRLAIISYSTGVSLVQDLVTITDDIRQELHTVVDDIQAMGATNLYDGLELGFLSLLSQALPDRPTRVILLSDGLPTVGVTSAAAIQEMAYGYILDGVGLTTVGVGSTFDVNLMQGLAEMGQGNYYFVEDVRAIHEVFIEELDYFLGTIAVDLQLEIRVNPAFQILRAYGWDYEQDYYLNAVRVRIPSLALSSRSGEEEPPEGRRGGGSNFFVEIRPIIDGDLDGWDPLDVAQVDFQYRPADSDEVQSESQVIRSAYPPGEVNAFGEYYSVSNMEKAFAVFAMYNGLFVACAAADYNYHRALWNLLALEESAVTWNAERADEDIKADLQLVAQFAHILETKGADASKYDPYASYSGCSTSGNQAGWAWSLLLLLGLARFRQLRNQ
ncbi:MAG: VWA domain-containing protein [Deltaproteobacteria bacterium]|nr:VWA domain-containing protein [Deltaproteobacteria bacterium]